jgi:hypothetical protein
VSGAPGELEAVAALVAALVDGRPAPGAPAALVRHHGLGPLAFTHGQAAFRGDLAAAAIRADQQRAIADEVVTALARAGIPAALLKGISYAGWLYREPGERPMTDVDLMVPIPAFGAAAAVLRRLGYWHAGPPAQRAPRHHAMGFKRPRASLDLHRAPAQIGRIAIDLDAVWARTSEAPWLPGARRLERIDEVLFHFANLARHDLIAPLLTYVDAGRLLRAVDEGGWGDLLERAAAWRFSRVLAVTLEWVELVIGWRQGPARWWMPRRDEVLRGVLPARRRQLVRKLHLVEGPRELAAYGLAVLQGALARRFPGQV